MSFPSRTLLGLAISAAALNTFAQDEPATITEETVVTANLTKQSSFETLASVDVINTQELQKLQISNFADALNLLSGIDVTQSGGPGTPVSVFSRGTSSQQTLMLINGQRFSSATNGFSSIQLLDPALMARTEYVRGSRSALYGSEAIGGVLQFFTFEEGKQPENWGLAEAGSYNTLRAAAGSRGTIDATTYSIGVAAVDSDGFDSQENNDNGNDDNDGFTNKSLNLSIKQELEGGFDIGLTHLQSKAENDYDSLYVVNPSRKQDLRVTQVSGGYTSDSLYSTRLNLAESKDHSKERNTDENVATSYFETVRQSAYWLNNFQFNESTLLNIGLDYHQEKVDADFGYNDFFTGEPATYTKTERDNTALFAQLQLNLNKVDIDLGVRQDDNSSYGTQTSGSAAAGYSFSDTYRAYISVAEGFQAPSFNALYYPGSGDSEILPQESLNQEIGLKARYQNWNWQVAAYKNEITNLIEWIPDESGNWKPYNVTVDIQGIDLSAQAKLGAFTLAGNATYVDPEYKELGMIVQKRSKEKLNLIFGHDIGNIDYGLIASYYGKREALGDFLPDYSLFDIYGNYALNSNVTLSAKVQNLADEDYVITPGYNTSGRTVKASVNVSF
ncbi:TonB-dependent receptor domain-containing protein [Agaribacterium sp. ZY112]|uniref:TonB-dependent receptor domain-containing protein n=1 Tax=Agaribacterium sp. ZY112 TaxID=3233574 RepID=UPI003526B9BA